MSSTFIAAVVIGGASLVVGAEVSGAHLLGLCSSVSSQWHESARYFSIFPQVVKGLIIIGAVWLDQLRAKEE
jgi:ribose/xylose/arabinose/galactoside ABC-type transport system permease subunit